VELFDPRRFYVPTFSASVERDETAAAIDERTQLQGKSQPAPHRLAIDLATGTLPG